MKKTWEKTASRIDSLTLRERGIIFVMFLIIVMELLNLTLLDPLSEKEKNLSQKLLQMEGEIQTLQDEKQGLAQTYAKNPHGILQSRMDVINKKLTEANKLLKSKQQQLIPPEEITQVLETILIQNRKLKLIALNNLPTTSLIEPDAMARDAAVDKDNQTTVSAPETDAIVHVFKHGVEITVQGKYFDLLAYLDALEKIPSQMFWDRISLDVHAYPSSELTFTVYTLSLDKTWLKV